MTSELLAPPRLTLAQIRAARALLGDRIRKTPVQPLAGPAVEAALPAGTRVTLKLELFQHTGSFKARGALVNTLSLTEAERARGICAISAGNHAIAAAFAARAVGASAKIVMKEGANPFRVAECRRFGGDIVFEPDFHATPTTAKVDLRRLEAFERRGFGFPLRLNKRSHEHLFAVAE